MPTDPKYIGHVAPSFETPKVYNTLVARPEYRISLKLGNIDEMFADAPDTKKGRMARLQVLGLFYFPLGHSKAEAAFDHARGGWTYICNTIAGGGLADAMIQDRLRDWVIPDGKLPPPAEDEEHPTDANFARLRLPGGFCFTDGFNGSAANDDSDPGGVNRYPAGWLSDMYDCESLYYTDNQALRKIPLVAKVEILDPAAGGWKPVKDAWVYFQLRKPYPLPAFAQATDVDSQVARPPLRVSTIGDGATYAQQANGAGPRKTVDDAMQKNAGHPTTLGNDDPQQDNCPSKWGGEAGKGSAADATDVTDVIFSVTSTANFNTQTARTTDHRAYAVAQNATPSGNDHKHAVKAQTNGDGEAGVVFMPSRCGGDRYRIRAYLGEVGSFRSNGEGMAGVRAETGTLVVWRSVRLSRYIRQECAGVAPGLLTAWTAQTASASPVTADEYLYRLAVTERSGTTYLSKGMPTADFGKRNVSVGLVGSALDTWVSQLAKSFVELTVDPGAALPEALTAAEWMRCRNAAKALGQARMATQGLNVDLDRLLYLDGAAPALAVDNACALVPMRVTSVYNPLVPANRRISTTVNASIGRLLDLMAEGVMGELSAAGSLPGLTLVSAPSFCTLAMQGYQNWDGMAQPYRGCYCLGGRAKFADKVRLYPTNPPTPVPGCGFWSNWGFTGHATHELGHCLFRSHAPGHSSPHFAEPPAPQPAKHDPLAQTICVMNYKASEGEYCGLCSLALRGWKIPLAP